MVTATAEIKLTYIIIIETKQSLTYPMEAAAHRWSGLPDDQLEMRAAPSAELPPGVMAHEANVFNLEGRTICGKHGKTVKDIP